MRRGWARGAREAGSPAGAGRRTRQDVAQVRVVVGGLRGEGVARARQDRGADRLVDVPEARGVAPEVAHGLAPEEEAHQQAPAPRVPHLVVEALAGGPVLRGEERVHGRAPVGQGQDDAAEELEVALEPAGMHDPRRESARLRVPQGAGPSAEPGAEGGRVDVHPPRTERVGAARRAADAQEAHEVGVGQRGDGRRLELDESQLRRVDVHRQHALRLPCQDRERVVASRSDREATRSGEGREPFRDNGCVLPAARVAQAAQPGPGLVPVGRGSGGRGPHSRVHGCEESGVRRAPAARSGGHFVECHNGSCGVDHECLPWSEEGKPRRCYRAAVPESAAFRRTRGLRPRSGPRVAGSRGVPAAAGAAAPSPRRGPGRACP